MENNEQPAVVMPYEPPAILASYAVEELMEEAATCLSYSEIGGKHKAHGKGKGKGKGKGR